MNTLFTRSGDIKIPIGSTYAKHVKDLQLPLQKGMLLLGPLFR